MDAFSQMEKAMTKEVKKAEELFPELRKEHGKKLRVLEIEKDDKGEDKLVCAALVPSRKISSSFIVNIDKNPAKAFEILIQNCLLTSKQEVLDDDALFFTTGATLAELVPIRSGKVKNF